MGLRYVRGIIIRKGKDEGKERSDSLPKHSVERVTVLVRYPA